ncbi:MAG TPA: cobalt ECF transporter T component CbiQ, partial [Anaerolineae bacterium]
EERRLLAASTGVLLARSVQLSGEVYLAMQARGLRGYPRTMDTFRMRGRDWVALAVVVAVAGGAMWLGR